ncbi:unnamed protein product [Symbiodinium sp. CCMP2456]|nr:unnamed protein product [Symbiodinium sp. CCMP2456]
MLSLAPTSGFRGERFASGGSRRMLGALPRQGRCWGFAPQLRCGLVLAIVPCALRPGHRHLRPLARRAFAAGSPSARWADLATSTSEATMTEALVEEAMTRFGRKQRKGVYLYQILAVAFSLPTKNAGRTAIKRGEVCVDGERAPGTWTSVLGAPIVNEDAGVVFAAAEAWRLQGKALPSALVKPVGRGKGNLFLQKLRVSLPPPEDLKSSERVTIAVPPSDRFDLLMDASARAFEYGWRTDEHGETKLLEDAGA